MARGKNTARKPKSKPKQPDGVASGGVKKPHRKNKGNNKNHGAINTTEVTSNLEETTIPILESSHIFQLRGFERLTNLD